MDLIVQINSREALDAALEAGVNGVTLDLPRNPALAKGSWTLSATPWMKNPSHFSKGRLKVPL